MLKFILKLIPAKYKWSVASKKMSYAAAKLVVSLLMAGKMGQHVGQHLTPDQMIAVEAAVAGLVIAGLEGAHDWLKLRFPKLSLL